MTVFEFDGGKKLPMRYNLRAFFEMDEKVCNLNELFRMYSADNPERDSPETYRKTLEIALILAKAAKADPQYTCDELIDILSPGEVFALQGMMMEEIGNGLGFENKKDGPRDLVLEQLDAEKGKNA